MEALAHYEAIRPELGERFAGAIFEAVNAIAEALATALIQPARLFIAFSMRAFPFRECRAIIRIVESAVAQQPA